MYLLSLLPLNVKNVTSFDQSFDSPPSRSSRLLFPLYIHISHPLFRSPDCHPFLQSPVPSVSSRQVPVAHLRLTRFSFDTLLVCARPRLDVNDSLRLIRQQLINTRTRYQARLYRSLFFNNRSGSNRSISHCVHNRTAYPTSIKRTGSLQLANITRTGLDAQAIVITKLTSPCSLNPKPLPLRR